MANHCSNCGTALSGNFCSGCGHASVDAQIAGPSVAEMASAARKADQRHGVPALLSFFIPGLGQLVKGDVLSAVFAFGGAVFFGWLCVAGIGFFLLPIFWVWQIYDAYTAPDGATKRELKRLAKMVVVLTGSLVAGAARAQVSPVVDLPADGRTTPTAVQLCSLQQQRLDSERQYLAASDNSPWMQQSVAQIRGELDACLKVAAQRIDKMVAERKAAAARRLEEQRVAILIASEGHDPKVIQLVKSRAICVAMDDRKEALDSIATEKRYAKKAGVVSLSDLQQYKEDLQSADTRIADAKSEIAEAGLKPIGCREKSMAAFLECIDHHGDRNLSDDCGQDYMFVAVEISEGRVGR